MLSGNVGSIPERLTETGIIEFVADVIGVSASTLNSVTVASDISEWDSIGFMSLLVALDQAGVPCDMGDTDSLQSISGVVGLFRAAGKLE